MALTAVAVAMLLPACNGDIETYVTDLQSPNPMVRLEAAKRTKHLEDKRLAAALVPLLQDDGVDIRHEAALSLQHIGTREQVPALIAALQDEDRGVRLAAVDALGRIRDDRAVEPLLALLATEFEPYSVVWALGNIGSADALVPLTPLLEHDDRYVRYQARRAMLKIH